MPKDEDRTHEEKSAPAATDESSEGTSGGSPPRVTVADALADFVQMFVDYVRQETDDLVKEKVVRPAQKAGQVVAFALAAAGVLFLGVGFMSAAALLVLADLMGWTAALTLVGLVLIACAGGFTYLRMKRMQR